MCNKKWIDDVEPLPKGALQSTFTGDFMYSQFATKSATQHMQDNMCQSEHMRPSPFTTAVKSYSHQTCGGLCCANAQHNSCTGKAE